MSRNSYSTNSDDVPTLIPSQDSNDTQASTNPSSTIQVSKTVLQNQNSKDTALKQISDSSNAEDSGTVQWNEKSENITRSNCDSLNISPNMSDFSHNLPKYNCPLCSFKCEMTEEFTIHYENVHHVSSKSQDVVCTKSSVQNSKDECSVSDCTPIEVEGLSTQTNKKTQGNKESLSSSKQSLTRTNNGHETTPPLMESSTVGDIQNQPIDNDFDDGSISQLVVMLCPVCKVSVMDTEMEKHLALHIPTYSCHMCTFSCHDGEEFSSHFALTHQIDQHLKPGMVGVKHHPIRILFRDSENLLTVTKFNRMKKNEHLKEVEIPGNGYCFVSSLMVTLAEQGVNKSFELLVKEIMNEVETHSKAYRWSDNISQPNNTMDDEALLKACGDFLQAGDYGNEYADICVGLAANALGINLNIFYKNNDSKYVLYTHDCLRYASQVNVFLIYYKKSPKNLDTHYNCFVKQDYYNQNKAAIKSRIICTEGFNRSQQVYNDMLLAQQLSHEEASQEKTVMRCSSSTGSKEQKRYVHVYIF